MKTKKNNIEVNKIFSDLILKNIVSVFIILSISMVISFFYNSYKTINYKYSIVIKEKRLWISDDNALQLKKGSNIDILLANFLMSLPKTVEEKKIINNQSGDFVLSFETTKKVDVESIMKTINKKNRIMLIKRFQAEVLQLEKEINQIGINADISSIVGSVEFNKDPLMIEKIGSLVVFYKRLLEDNTSLNIRLDLLKFYLDNFEKLFQSDVFYSLNGWNIEDNNFNNTEKFFAGLILGFLICSIYLFFKSKYFRIYLKN